MPDVGLLVGELGAHLPEAGRCVLCNTGWPCEEGKRYVRLLHARLDRVRRRQYWRCAGGARRDARGR